MVRRKTPLPVWRAILGAAQLIPGPRELPICGRGLKSFTAAAPFLLLLPSVLACLTLPLLITGYLSYPRRMFVHSALKLSLLVDHSFLS